MPVISPAMVAYIGLVVTAFLVAALVLFISVVLFARLERHSLRTDEERPMPLAWPISGRAMSDDPADTPAPAEPEYDSHE